MKLLGIDLGKKRIGVALGDTDTKIVIGLSTLLNDRQLIDQLRDLTLEHHVTKLIVGLPKTMSGNVGDQVAYTKKWVKQITHLLNVDVAYEDERLSSKMARDSLASLGNDLIKADIDQAAAVLILQSYLDKYSKI